MLDGDDSLVISDDEHSINDHSHGPLGASSTNGHKPADLLVDDGEEVNLHNDAPSKLRLDEPAQEKTNDVSGGSGGFGSVSSPGSSFAQNAPVEENIDFTLIIKILDFEKRGDGINAYLVYKVVTQSRNVAGISDRTHEVWRRFSDFLGLHEKLVEKYLHKGVIVPCTPEKSIAAMTKTKSAADPSVGREVGSGRARQLERFLNRVVQHPKMRADCDVRDFLTMEAELPKASNTAALSSAGMKRMFKQVGEVFSKMAFHMEEGDRWFEQTQSHIEELDESLRKLLTLSESLQSQRKELAHSGETMAKALSMLASCEESTALARALSHLTETEENLAAVNGKQADNDQARLVEAIGEYVSLFGSLKEVFNERVRVWQAWQSAQQNLAKKREQKARFELSGKTDKAQSVKEEMDDAVSKMDALEVEFGELSKWIREEVGRFESQRRKDLRTILIDFIEGMVETQQEILKLWERFAPETQSIIA